MEGATDYEDQGSLKNPAQSENPPEIPQEVPIRPIPGEPIPPPRPSEPSPQPPKPPEPVPPNAPEPVHPPDPKGSHALKC
jgi:hypothetical protein